ncbi:Alpha/beta hydrolase fold-3 [Penicillium robsamsonii]|uniref:Alpha/beta hydrolase fold-3 n=1 Tax=Penicillium robsamsonii TaxID=1792511 RepID=UPI002549121E|nr:Alpha/beta hydrolase fold-3 [Penicillium robsamsonii]KAJ5834326.1 Alpha/beta hydrolase fold-3 [Penicillium robsamsonii]
MSVTHVFKVVDGLSLEIDALSPPTKDENAPVVLHFHGGFLFLGEKTTFPPHWLINACQKRGWTYATASYRLLPEAPGLEILQDAIDAVNWVHTNISKRVIIAGSSAGGYLALAATAHPATPRPLALLSIYGMMDSSSERYINPGQPLVAPVEDEAGALKEVEDAMRDDAIDGYAFPTNPPADRRFGWIKALHQAAQYPDVITRKAGLAARIADEGIGAISVEDRALFPVRFGLNKNFPPTVLVHGDTDELVGIEQSVAVAEALEELGVDVSFERAEGQGHGFEAKEVIDLDADELVGDKAVIDPLRRVIAHLERHVQ